MYRRILVPLDGSAVAERALPLAGRIARASGAALRLVLVHHATPASAITVPQIVPADYDAVTRESEESYLGQVAERAGGDGTAVTTALLEGVVADAIAADVAAAGADLVVMTTHGRGPVSRFWMGSVADELVRTLTVPVLLIRADAEQDHTMPRRILVPLDGSPRAERALEHAAAFARLGGGGLELLQVVPPIMPVVPDGAPLMPPAPPAQAGDLLVESARAYVERQAEEVRGRGLAARAEVVVDASAAAAIVEVSQRDGIDLVAIATHGAGGLRRAVLGSVTDKVLRTTRRPLLVIRPEPG